MAKEYSINIPILNLTPANQIIDYLNGKASLAIVNPYFQLPGIQTVQFINFLPIKPINGDRKGYQVVSPQIVYKTQNGNFTSKIFFNDDDGSNELTTNLRFYPLQETALTPEEYNKKFKVLQKVVASRGVVKDGNTQLINECVINYQLSQAFELCYMIKMLGLQPTQNDTDATILQQINMALNNNAENPQTKQKIDDYLKFNTTPAPNTQDARYITVLNQTMAKANSRNKRIIQSIFDIFADDMFNKAQTLNTVQQKTQYDQLFINYNSILNIANYQNMGSACYIKEYIGNANTENQYSGKSFYTDYTLKCAAKSTSKTMIKTPDMGNSIPRPMNVMDFLNLVRDNTTTPPTASSKPIVAKLFMSVDFDFRVYAQVNTRQAINVRYMVHLMFYKENNISLLDSIDYENVYMPVMEGASEFTQMPNPDFGNQQAIPDVSNNFAGQM